MAGHLAGLLARTQSSLSFSNHHRGTAWTAPADIGILPRPDRESINFSKSLREAQKTATVRGLATSNSKASHLVSLAWSTGYLGWPRKIQKLVEGRHVFDFGSGRSLHGVGYMLAGALSYLGYDPMMDFSMSSVKNKHSGKLEDIGVPLEALTAEFKNLSFTSSLGPKHLHRKFGTVVMHNVSEHVSSLEAALRVCWELLDRDGFLVIHHHNYYSWDGHHCQPKLESQVDLNEESHREVADWAHVTFDPPAGHPIRTSTLNRIRLDDFRVGVEEFFEVEFWREVPSPVGKGGGRVSKIPGPLLKLYSPRELTVKNVLLVARPRTRS